MHKVSFVLPAFKRCYLKDAISSILSQTFTDFELIVVDDSSPENLKDVVVSFTDPRIKFFRNEKNLGGTDLVSAWTQAMQYATGEWCVLASDDDVYEPEFLYELLKLTEKYPRCDVFHCREMYINSTGEVCGFTEPRAEYETPVEFLYNLSVKRLRQSMPEFLFRKKVWQKCNGFVSAPRAWFSDDMTWLALACENGIACSSRPLFRWRASGINITTLNTDVAEKIAACELYRAWIRSYLDKVQCHTLDDSFYFPLIADGVERFCDRHIEWLCRIASFRVWIRVLRNSRFPAQIKRRVILKEIEAIAVWPINFLYRICSHALEVCRGIK